MALAFYRVEIGRKNCGGALDFDRACAVLWDGLADDEHRSTAAARVIRESSDWGSFDEETVYVLERQSDDSWRVARDARPLPAAASVGPRLRPSGLTA